MRVGLDSKLGKGVIKMAGSKTFMRIGPKVVPHFDRFLHKMSGGKFIKQIAMQPGRAEALPEPSRVPADARFDRYRAT